MRNHSPQKLKGASTKGFTLIETLVGTLILVSATVGVINIARMSIVYSGISRERIVATYLAQEPIEALRGIRDGDLTGWPGTMSPCLTPQTCRIDTSTVPLTIQQCTGGVCPVLLFNDATGLYGYGSGNPTLFTRTVTVQNPEPVSGNTDETTITVIIQWPERSQTRIYTVKTSLFDW